MNLVLQLGGKNVSQCTPAADITVSEIIILGVVHLDLLELPSTH